MKKLIHFIVVSQLLFACNSSKSDRENGNLNETFIDSASVSVPPTSELINTPVILTPEQEYEQKKVNLLSEGWKEKSLRNGQLSSCYNFQPQTGTVNNYLKVYVGSGTDVVIKVMDLETDVCVRYVFINSGTHYSIENIPEGKYYLKIAYGREWLSKNEKNKCIGMFLSNPMYEKGDDIMDFNVKQTYGGYSIPSFSLELDVISSNTSNSFNSASISESEFNQ
jgi:hypothetical protein